MPTQARRLFSVRRAFRLLLFIILSAIAWYWPQTPRWRLSETDFPDEPEHAQPLFFSDDASTLYLYATTSQGRRASVFHLDSRNGRFLDRVEIWRDRPKPSYAPW